MALDLLQPVSLAGPHARLEPLDASHGAALAEAVVDGELWKLWYTSVPSPERMAAEIERRLGLWRAGSMLPFTVFDAAGRVVGMTTYMNVDSVHRRVEIGSTWYARSVQRSGLNTQCKRLLLGHAFDALGCIAVEFRTHRLNAQSRRAIERLGAQLDGILRAHQRTADGSLRDTAVYSITATEWPTVRTHLDFQLQRGRSSA
ncbi:GNAT family protein [Variovorax sp. YR752]|uniref:GNAT family N-acetyltransferase n=1 Tax=Variovorax sp. YR752 TaxID=1884383 RepID=UPI003137996A